MMSYRIRFRNVASYDTMTPLMHLPMQETVIEAVSEDAARASIRETFIAPGGSLTIESCEVDAHWTKYHEDLRVSNHTDATDY